MAKNKEQPDPEDEQATVEWLNEEGLDPQERQLRASNAKNYETRRPGGPRGGVMNAAADIHTQQGPPSSNQ